MGVPLKVLLVEDSEDDALLVLRELRRGGYEPDHERVDTAAGVEAALEAGGWDVVISDHSMPAFSSEAALELVRGRGFPDLPFIIVSGRIGEDVAVAAMRAGAQDYIMKDNLRRLNSAIERELREAEGRRERKRGEEALKSAEEKYRSIFENAVEGIFQTTAGGRFVTANPALARMFGHPSPEALLDRISSIGDQIYADPERSREFGRVVRRDGFVRNFEMRIRRGDGAVAWISVNARAIRDANGELTGYEGFVEDVTERKRAEEALGEIREAERRRIARELHDDVLQDLTYALQAMQVTARTPEGTDRAAETGRQIEALRRSVSGIRNAIYDLRLEGDEARTLARSLESIVELNRQMAPACSFEMFVEDGFPTSLRGAPAMEVARVVQEALANVRRHSGARRATVSLGTDAGAAWVEVEDDGRGFGPGTAAGMGITGMQERARSLGGEVEVKSEPGTGTTVRLRVALGALIGEGETGRARA